tara:strand:- start:126 stop:584 length:459 start_codon:yes stop_codon:yes gene_type:complete
MTPLHAYLNSPRARRALSKKPGEEGFSLIELVVVVAVLAVLSAIAIPSFMSIADKARAAAASNTVATVAKECAVKLTNDSTTTQTFAAVNLDGYSSFTFAGSTTNCSDSGLITATSANTAKYPTFNYNVATGAKTCTASGDAVNLGCTGGTW